MKSEVFNIDCMEGMKDTPDNYYDLAVVDPPYGIGESTKDASRNGYGVYIKRESYKSKNWDNSTPTMEYFIELGRVSKNQIIFGANYFISKIPFDSSCWLVWDKNNSSNDFADCELAYTSFNTAVRRYKYTWHGMLQEDMKNKEIRIHPTQKPIALYEWIFKNYASEGQKILDSHVGSGSSRIAAYNYKMDFTGYEIDKDYFEAAEKRFKDHVSQLKIFL